MARLIYCPKGTWLLESVPFLIDAQAQTPRPLAQAGVPAGVSPRVWLRELLHGNPDLLPVAAFGPGLLPLVPLARGVETAHGVVDNLLVSPNGRLTLVLVSTKEEPVSPQELIEHGRRLARWSPQQLLELARRSQGDLSQPSPFDRQLDAALEIAGISRGMWQESVGSNLRCANFLLLLVGQHLNEEQIAAARRLQTVWGIALTLGLVELRLFQSSELPEGSLLALPRVVSTGIEPRYVEALDHLSRDLERIRLRSIVDDRPLPPQLLPPCRLAAFHNQPSCRAFHERLSRAGIAWQTRVRRGEAEVLVAPRHEAKAKALLAEHLEAQPDAPATGFQVTRDYALFGALVASALGMILLAVEFRTPFDLVRPTLLVLLGGFVGWVADDMRISLRATGELQASAGKLAAAGGAILAGLMVFSTAISR